MLQPVRLLTLSILILGVPAFAVAEPCVLAYPLTSTIFRFDASRFELLGPASPYYDPDYSLVGGVLWDIDADRIAYEVYRAPALAGFEPAVLSGSQFYTVGNRTTIAVDGFAATPRQLNDIVVQFIAIPAGSVPEIFVDGAPVKGLRHVIPRLVVSTPVDGGFFSDTVEINIEWRGAPKVRVAVYADRNGNRVFDGEPCSSILIEDLTVPVREHTWGSLKALYGE